MKSLKFHRAIVAIAVMLIGWLPSLAHHFEINGIFYNVISTTEVEVTYKGSSYYEFHIEYNGSVVIPSLVEYGGFTYSVTSIGDEAFRSCTSLTSIEIPNSVTSIGDEAFNWCLSLTSIEIPNSVTSIGNRAFFGCAGLTNIVVDAGNSIYDSRNDCNAIIETASNTLIAGCQNTIIPNNVTSIGQSAFYWCTSLTSIEIPNSVTSIGQSAFNSCESLTGIQIPNSVTSIGDAAFRDCTRLTNVVIGNSVTSIGHAAFRDCTRLTNVVIGNSVTSIGLGAFNGCSSLTSVVIPNSVTSIGYGAFHECPGLTSIVVDSGNSKYDSRNGCNAIIETASNTLIAGCQNTIIPNSVTSIGHDAFYGCTSLTSIQIPNSVTSIGYYAFYECSSLTRIICTATTPPTIESDTFSEYSAFLFVPIGCKATYKVADYWKNFNNIIEVALSNYIMLDKSEVEMILGETFLLTATVLPETTSNKSVEWKSSNDAVATVNNNGEVTAIAVGEAIITVTTTDGTNLSATCKVTVVPTLVVSVEVTPNSVEAEENSEVQLSVNILPENATYKSVEWSSSNDAIASVNANGLVKIRKEGNVVITATTTDGTNLSATCRINVYSGIDGVNGNDVIVATIGDNIVVKNAKLGSVVNVYSSNGALIKSMTATDGSVVIEAPVKGVYVVKVGKKTVKVIL